VKKSGSAGEQLKEAQAINKSLSALGDVIAALAGDSVRTRAASTAMLATWFSYCSERSCLQCSTDV
jgi:Kinesin motor domain